MGRSARASERSFPLQISSRFTIAVHMLLAIAFFEGDRRVTSAFLAGSIQVNPVVIRRLLLMLKGAGLVTVERGRNGSHLARSPEEITLYDVYRATELLEGGELFHFHERPNPACPVGGTIHSALDGRLEEVQQAMEKKLGAIRLAEVLADMKKAQSEKA